MIALALLTAFASDSWGQSKKQSSGNETPKAEKAAKSDQRGTPDQPFSVNVVPTDEQKADTQKKDAEAAVKAADDKRLVDYTGYQVLIGIVTFFIFVLQLIAFSLQARYMRRTVVEMRKTTHATVRAASASQKAAVAAVDAANHIPRLERAYVFLGLDYKADLKDYVLSYGDDLTSHSTIEFGFKNHGRTPALVEALHTAAKYWPDTNWPPISLAEGMFIQPGFVISGGENIGNEYVIHFPLSKGDREKAESGNGFVLFWGKIVYRDVFGERREAGWCRGYQRERHGWRFAGDEKLNYYT